ncbi:MAG: hypothetical protein E6H80_09370 [Betaproteobacteria bacterium]|nr:MAG: hypothetical protein E6H80_09370 [Betaproteobacteria bacterium]
MSASSVTAAPSSAAPRASPAMKTTQAPSTIAVATPIEKVMSSVAKKSTTMRRTLDLPLAASI